MRFDSGRRPRLRHWLAPLAVGLAFLFVGNDVRADARSDYLIRLLQESSSFRVRAQAALSLGRIEGEPSVATALSRSLSDRHPAVRTASASALERLGDPNTLDALRRRRRDRNSAVRNAVRSAIRTLERLARTRPRSATVPALGTGRARYYVGIGQPASSAGGIDRRTLSSARDFLAQQLSEFDGLVVAPPQESATQVRRTLRERRMAGYYIDSSIVRIENRGDGIRAVVSVILNTYPGRDMRAILSGAATVQGGGRGDAARTQAIQGAYTGALRRLPQALRAADARDGG